jgi:hypothetical protein
MGQGYKGASKTVTIIGRNTEIIKLPSKAASITSIKENGNLLPVSDYELEANGRFVTRPVPGYLSYLYNPYGATSGVWCQGYKYLVEYTEPAIAELPDEWALCASNCVAMVAMFAKKYREYGIALTAQDAGSAGRVSTQNSTSFPASLVEELRRTIKAALPRGSV